MSLPEKQSKDHTKQVDYTETFYPRSAEESESEAQMTDEEPGNTTSSSQRATPIPSPECLVDNSVESNSVKKDENVNSTDNEANITCGVCFQILLNPMSLGCGHSYCELCLAGMWRASRQPIPQCPMCREAWGKPGDRFPSVNVMLRDIIEQLYPGKLKERREAITEDERELLSSFTQARVIGARPRMQNGNRPVGVNIQLNRTTIFWLVVLFVVAMIFTIFLVSCVVWLNDLRYEFVLKPVGEWNHKDVLQWMEGLGESVRKECAQAFEREKIDGAHLLSLTDDSLIISLGVKDPFTRESLLLSINELKRKNRLEPRNFLEFRAVNREEIMLLTFLYYSHPRLTFLYLYFFKYQTMFLPLVRSQLNLHTKIEEGEEGERGVLKEPDEDVQGIIVDRLYEKRWEETADEEGAEPEEGENPSQTSKELLEPTNKQLLAFTMEILLVPHVVVMAFMYVNFSKDSILFYVLMWRCGIAMFVELRLLRFRLRHPRGRDQYTLSQVTKTVRNQIFGYFVKFVLGSIAYMILPSLLMDMFFYLNLFLPVLTKIVGVLKPCVSRTVQFVLAHINRRLAQRGVVA